MLFYLYCTVCMYIPTCVCHVDGEGGLPRGLYLLLSSPGGKKESLRGLLRSGPNLCNYMYMYNKNYSTVHYTLLTLLYSTINKLIHSKNTHAWPCITVQPASQPWAYITLHTYIHTYLYYNYVCIKKMAWLKRGCKIASYPYPLLCTMPA